MSEPLIDASTVLLLRDGAAGAPEIFMVRRHGKSRFMGGMYVFPGGKRDDADSTLALESFCNGLTGAGAASVLGLDDPARALGLFVAAVRETFEEANVLFGAGTNRDERRAELQRGEADLLTLCREQDWRLDLSPLRYFAHWVTPPVEPRRFSARFFLARAPEDQDAIEDMREVHDGVWLTSSAAIDQYRRGDIELPPPTLRVLEQLAHFDSVASALDWAPHAPIASCAPQLVQSADGVMLCLEGDPEHPFAPGDTIQRFRRDGRCWVSDFPD